MDPSARPDLLERRIIEALERDLMTQGRARELLRLSVWDDVRASAQYAAWLTAEEGGQASACLPVLMSSLPR